MSETNDDIMIVDQEAKGLIKKVQWLSLTSFSTDDKDLGHQVADLLLEAVVNSCKSVREEAEFLGFEDPDFGPALSALGQQAKDNMYSWGIQANAKLFDKLRSESNRREIELEGMNKVGEKAVFMSVKETFDEEEDSDEETDARDVEMEGDIKDWKKSLKPKNFWKWERIRDAEYRTSTLFGKGAMPSGPKQGCLNDSWLTNAMSLVATRRHMLMGIRDTHQSIFHFPSSPSVNYDSRKLGVFVVRLFFNFRWHFVLVDDRFVCTEEANGNRLLLFCHNENPKEMWAALCEKAYAKACGSYEALNFGYVKEALQSLTGGNVGEYMVQKMSTTFLTDQTKSMFWKELKGKISQGSCLVGCVFESGSSTAKDASNPLALDTKTGLIVKHPYIIVDAKDIKVAKEHVTTEDGTARVLRLRNVAGPTNWQKQWGDQDSVSAKYKKVLRKSFKQIEVAHDGFGTSYVEGYDFETSQSDFLISLEDWQTYFQRAFVVNEKSGFGVETDDYNVKIETGESKGSWDKGIEFRLQPKIVSEEERARKSLSVTGQEMQEYATVIITLWQEDRRMNVGYASLTERRKMKMVVMKKSESIDNIREVISGTKPAKNQPKVIDGALFTSTIQKMETGEAYFIQPNLATQAKKAPAIRTWLVVEADAPFTLKPVKGKKTSHIDFLQTVICEPEKGFVVQSSPRVNPPKGHEDFVRRNADVRQLSLQKLMQLGDEEAAWQISVNTIKEEKHAVENAGAKQEEKDSDSEDDDDKIDDPRIQLWKSIRKEEWDADPPAFDDVEERNVSPKKRPNEQALPSYEDGYGIIDAEAEERALKSAAMMALPYEEIKHENGTFAPPKSPFKSPKLSGESTIVFRGMLIMNVAPTDGEPEDTFVLVTVTETVEPYSMLFEVTHPGTSTSASRTFTTTNMENIIANKPRSMRSVDEESDPRYLDSEEAVQRWIDTGDLPDHDDLVTWLIGRMKFTLKDEQLIIPTIDKIKESKKEEEDGDSSDEIEMSQYEDEDESDAESWGPIMDEIGDQGMVEEEDSESETEEEDEESWNSDELNAQADAAVRKNMKGSTAREMMDTAGVYLKPTDPFARASWAAKMDLKRTKELEIRRAKIAKVREDTIYRKSREKRAKEAYTKHMKHLQAKELGRAIMLQEMALTIEEKAKRSVARDMRLKRTMRSQTNPYKQNGQKSLPGTVIGPGPISATAYDDAGALRQARENSKYVFDMNGRRHRRKDMGTADENNPVERVINRIKRLAEVKSAGWHLDLRKPFAQFDKNGDGMLSHDEFVDGLEEIGVQCSEEEVNALLNHFDTNNNGTINFQEFVWSFFNRRNLISQWRLQKGPGKRGVKSFLNSFYKYDVDGSGKLGRKEFLYAVQDLGLKLPEWQVESLADRFDADRDGLISPTEFIAFMDSLSLGFQKEKKKAQQEQRQKHMESKLKSPRTIQKTNERLEYETMSLKVKAQRDEIRRLKAFVEAQERDLDKRPGRLQERLKQTNGTENGENESLDGFNRSEISMNNPEYSEEDGDDGEY